MIVQVDPGSPVPVFEQLRAQVERLVASGALAPGSRLPTIRHLAADLGIARGTVQRVYDELARDGWVRTAGRHGTVVADRVPGPADPAALPQAADRLALVARQLGIDARDAHAALDAALARAGAAGTGTARAVTARTGVAGTGTAGTGAARTRTARADTEQTPTTQSRTARV